MKILKFVVILLLCGFVERVNGQEITDAVKREIKERVEQKVSEFTNSLEMMVNDSLSHEVRKEYQVLALHLFMGMGEPYKYYDFELEEEIRSSGVKMYTSSVNRVGISKQRLKGYIRRLYNPDTRRSELPYRKINIDFADHVKISDIERVGDHYECAAVFVQRFYGYRDGGFYGDETVKKIRCYIDYKETIPGKGFWDIKLGDIYVLETKRL